MKVTGAVTLARCLARERLPMGPPWPRRAVAPVTLAARVSGTW